MVDYGRVQSTAEPQPVVVDDFSVWVHTDITTVNEGGDTEAGFVGYEFHMVQYTKDEYITLLQERLQITEEQVTETQLALCDVYELMLAGGDTNG